MFNHQPDCLIFGLYVPSFCHDVILPSKEGVHQGRGYPLNLRSVYHGKDADQ